RRNVRAVIRDRGLSEMWPARLAANVAELRAFADTESFRRLAEAFKRVRNIARELKDADAVDIAVLRPQLSEPAELALCDDIERRRGVIERAARDGRDFKAAYTEAAQFEPAVARFFTEVFVM